MPLDEEKAETFFREFWHKKPLLMRDAIPNFKCPLDTNELAGLACEDEFSSRLSECERRIKNGRWKLDRFRRKCCRRYRTTKLGAW